MMQSNSNLCFDANLETLEKYVSFEIIIKDTGMGISKEGLKQLFMEFGKL